MENSVAEAPKGRKSKAESKLSPSPSVKPDEPEVKHELTEVQQSARERGQRDLFFFTKEICQYKDLIERVHRPVCDIYGPPPDPSKPFEDQDTIHNYLILDPRGEFKTSISLAKSLQNWINFPEVATLRMSGKEPLVKLMVQEVKDQLLTNSTLRELYPEHVPWSEKKNEIGMAPSDWGTAYGITNPSRKRPRKEPTLSISTLESVKAGTHYEWVTGDDLVHEKNYQTRDLLLKTISDWDLSRNLLNPRAYRELLGTRYDWSDLYGHTIERNKGQWRIHCRPIWTYDLRFALASGFYVPPDYQVGDLIFLHPERWTYKELLEIQADNPYLFNCQRLNDPMPVGSYNFPEQELIRHTIKREKYPDTGMMNLFLTWFFDLADPEAEAAVGVVGAWDSRGRLFIVDLARGAFKPSMLIDLTIGFWQKWPLSKVGFEDNRRQRMLEAGLLSRLKQLRMQIAIDWIKFGGNQQSEESEVYQVLSLEPLLRENQLWFHDELPHLGELYTQFKNFPKFRLRGIPIAISRLMAYRTQTQTLGNMAVYGSELYSPALSWDRQDSELGAGLTG